MMKKKAIVSALERTLAYADVEGLKRMLRDESGRTEDLRRLLCATLDAVGHPVQLVGDPRAYAHSNYILDFESARPGLPRVSTRGKPNEGLVPAAAGAAA